MRSYWGSGNETVGLGMRLYWGSGRETKSDHVVFDV